MIFDSHCSNLTKGCHSEDLKVGCKLQVWQFDPRILRKGTKLKVAVAPNVKNAFSSAIHHFL